MFSSRLSGLPGHSRQILLLAALEDSGHLASLGRAAEQFGGLDQLAPAEEAGLVLVDESHRTLTFRHPLARATVVAQSTDIERRRAHRTWAGIFTGEADRRAWHLAHACVNADEGVAELLEAVGHTSLKRGDAQGAITALTRAADLSAVRTERGRRLIEAAYVSAVVAGQLANAASLLDAAREVDPTATESLRAAITAANLLFNSECDVDAAHQVLVGALLRYADGYSASDATVVDAMHSLFMICWYASRPELWEPFNEILGQIEPEPPPLLALSARMLGDPVYQAATWLTRLDASAESVRRDSDPVTITRTAIASIYIDRVGGLRDALWRAIRDGRATGAVPLSISAMVSSCVDDWLTGQWDEALELADEGVRLSRQHGYRRFTEILGGYIRPLILVVRGAADALAEAEDMAGWADQQGIGMATTFAHHVQTLWAIGSGDFGAAFRHATAISPAGSLPRYTPHALWMLLDVVEAGVRSGRRDDAAAHVAAMREANVATISPRLALIVAGAAAIAADGDEATQLYEHALTLPRSDRWPFDLARITLCYGEHLRRQNDASEAWAHLRTAEGIFEQLKAEPWATRAKNELRASGVLRPTSPSPVAELTPQELEIAQLAARGLSNKEIAGRLYLSHRTVGARLYRVFPKLGVTTRAGLRDALDAWSAGSEASPPSPSTATTIDSARSLGRQ
jgi:DNA-binding CsgD family transcriptional regulator